MQKFKIHKIFLMLSLVFVLVSGCNKDTNETSYKSMLENDAKIEFKNSLQNDYNQIGLFRGEMYKFSIVSTLNKKTYYIGSSMGVIAASTINPDYQFIRIRKGENLNNEIINTISTRKLLEVVARNQVVLDNLYRVVLTPLNNQLEIGKNITPAQQVEIDELLRLTDRLLEDYLIIIKSDDLTDSNLNVQLKSMLKSQDELLNLTIPKI